MGINPIKGNPVNSEPNIDIVIGAAWKQPEGSTTQSLNATQTGQKGPKQEITREKLDKAVQVANSLIKMVDARFEYTINEETNREIIEVYNRETNEKIRQIPPEEVIGMLEKMYEMLGFFIDERM